MKRIEAEHKLDENGVLHLDLPIGAEEAGRQVLVTVTLLPRPMSQEEWHGFVEEMAGSWQGDFERPVDPPLTDPEWMNDPNYAGFVKISDYPAGESPGAEDDPSGVRRNQLDRPDRSS